MSAPSPARKGGTLIFAVVVAGILLFLAGQAVVMTGTKASFTFASVSPVAPPAGTATTTKPAAGTTTTATATPAATTTGAR